MDDDPAAPAADYARSADFRWTERAFELLEDGSLRAEIRQPDAGVAVAHVWGRCPRCGHHLDDWQPLSAVTGTAGRRGPDGSGAGDEPIDVSCGCGVTHSGAPADTTGCGVSFRVELETGPGNGTGARSS